MNILIVGLGSLGYRHYQSIKSNYSNTNFFFLEKKNKIDIIKNIKNIDKNFISFNQNIKFIKKLDEIKGINYQLIIISTTADNRGKLLRKIVNKLKYKTIISEKPLTNNSLDLKFFKKINIENIFVNHHRRYQEVHKYLKRLKLKINKIRFESSNLGLLCNFSHHVDFARMLIDKRKKITDIKCNFNKIFESKRTNYFEVNGKMLIKFSNGPVLEIINYSSSNKQNKTKTDRKVLISSNSKTIILNENTGEIFTNKKLIKKIPLKPQSKLTGIYLRDIINNKCKLPNLSDCLIDYEKILPLTEKSIYKLLNKSNYKKSLLNKGYFT